MSVTLLEQPPLTLHRKLGPYRRADYAALPDEPRCELIFGRLYLSPGPVLLHQFLVTHLTWRLKELAAQTGGMAVVAPMDVHLAEHSVVQPDVLYILPERRGIMRDWVYGAPDLVVEILSPSTASRDRLHKLNLYAQHGVAEYWIVDPGPRHIDFCVLEDGEIAVGTPEAGTWRSPAMPGLELDVDELWMAVEREFGPPAGT